MQTLRFSFNGEHELILPDGSLPEGCAREIIEGRSYPFSTQESPKKIVDIGAHAGEFTIMCALIWPKAEIHAYEPYHPVAELLRINMSSFKNVVVHEAAVGFGEGPCRLHISGDGSLCNSLNRTTIRTPTDESVIVKRSHPSEIRDLKPDMLKIDAEGVELDIIRFLYPTQRDIYRYYVEYHSEVHRKAMMSQLDKTHNLSNARVLVTGQGEISYERKEK